MRAWACDWLAFSTQRGVYEVHDTRRRSGDQIVSDEVAMSDTSRDSAPSNNNAESNASDGKETPPVVLLSNANANSSDAWIYYAV